MDESSYPSSELDFIYFACLCQKKQSMQNIEKNLSDILARFRRIKGALSPSTRRSLQTNFSSLYDLCERLQDAVPNPTIDPTVGWSCLQTTRKYQIAEREITRGVFDCLAGPVGDLVQERNSLHRRLEETLANNKAEVLRLLALNGTNGNEIAKLREQAMRITEQLTSEIQREVKEQEEAKNKTSE